MNDNLNSADPESRGENQARVNRNLARARRAGAQELLSFSAAAVAGLIRADRAAGDDLDVSGLRLRAGFFGCGARGAGECGRLVRFEIDALRREEMFDTIGITFQKISSPSRLQ
jgi:hypothetical protein